ncbi:transposase [Streptomyces tauricus]|uniref:transposase n=1 Tax=Streptomyces tauricus TaxID=68274 RepID=UPI003F4BFDFA
MDSQSVRAGERGGLHGYDGGKKVNGIKRHLLVDTRCTNMEACVSPAGVGDDGAAVLFSWAATGITVQVVQVVQRRDGGFRSTWTKSRLYGWTSSTATTS